jgi:hypothetical protein
MKARIKVTDRCGNKSYLVINRFSNYNGIQYTSKNQTPLCLSNISSNAVELGFALDDCTTKEEVLAVCKKKMDHAYIVELI